MQRGIRDGLAKLGVAPQPLAATEPAFSADATSPNPHAEGLPAHYRLIAYIVAIAWIGFVSIVGPPLYACNTAKDNGALFYGTTTESCVSQHLSAHLSWIVDRLETALGFR